MKKCDEIAVVSNEKDFIHNQQAYSIFQQPWWLDAVAPYQWKQVVVKNGNEVIARLPYVIRKKWGLTFLMMPKLTPHLGPWLRPSKAKYPNQLGEQIELVGKLIEKLPEFDIFLQTLNTGDRSGVSSLNIVDTHMI